jgi:thiol peroxidase
MIERPNLQAFKGNPLTLVGTGTVSVGDAAPDFTVMKTLVEPVSLSSFKDKTVVLNVVPSLDTPVCATQTKRFNQEAAALGPDVVVLTLSVDTPMAQARWCGAEGVSNVVTASDFKDREFGDRYGLRIKELGLLARAVIVVKGGRVTYMEICKELSKEPDYESALAAVRS